MIQAYVAHFKMSKSLLQKYLTKPTFHDAKDHFKALMRFLIPEQLELVIDTIMKFLYKEQLWKVECICCEIFDSLLSCQAAAEMLVDSALHYIEEMIISHNIEEARHVVHVLFSIIREEHFQVMQASGVTRLLTLYHLSVGIEENKFYLIRTGFEMVLQKLLKVMHYKEVSKLFPMFLDLTFERSLTKYECKDFGLTIFHGVARLKANRICQNLRQTKHIKRLLQLMTDTCEIKSYLATRFLTILMDHHGLLLGSRDLS